MNDIWTEIKSALGDPYFEDESTLLFAGDCLERLRDCPPDSFGLVVTSPPYNIGKEYERPLPLPDYLSWCEDWMKALYTTATPDASFWLNLGYVGVPDRGKAVPLPYMLWDRSPWFLLQEIVWNYGAGVAARHTFSPRNEKFLWYVKDERNYHFDLDAVRDPNVKYPRQFKNGKLKVNPLGKNPTDVWAIPKVTSGAGRSSKERTPHPAQFPGAVIERIVKACSGPHTIVLDPFVGSGTTCVTAAQLGRRSIGFELRSEYLDLAVQRLKAVSDAGTQENLGI